MNFFSLLSLLASLISFFLGSFILSKNPKDKKNFSFFLFALINGILSFSEFEFRTAETYETAYFWYKTYTIWPFSLSISLYFIKNFINHKNTLLSKLIYSLIHLSALILFLIDLLTDYISAKPTLAYWGWKSNVQDNFVTTIAFIWIILISAVIMGLTLKYHIENNDINIKNQAKLILAGFSIVIITGIITDVLFPYFKYNIPELSNASNIIGYLLIAYAIYKYKLFIITPSSVSEQIVENISGSLILTDREGKIIYFNKTTEKLFGLRKNQLSGKPINIVFKNETLDKGQNQLITNMKYKESYITDGIELSLIVNRICIRDQYKQIQGFVYLADDITNINTLRNAKNKAEESDKLKSNFIELIYQEISKPLNIILKQTESLLTSKLSDYDKKEYLNSINDSSVVLNKFIRKVLDIVKIDNKQLLLEEKSCSLNKIIDEIHNMIKNELDIRNKKTIDILLIKPLEDKNSNIIIDQSIVIKIFETLIEVILTYTNSGTIKTGYFLSEENTIHFHISSSNFILSDIYISKVLNALDNLDYNKIRIYGQPGLNLSIVKQYAELLQGTVWAEYIGKNMQFFIKLKYRTL